MNLTGKALRWRAHLGPSPLQANLSDAYLAAKSFFDLGEYQRTAHTLRPRPDPQAAASSAGPAAPPNQEELFLRCYALYLAGEKVGDILDQRLRTFTIFCSSHLVIL
jgi:hypothetical protein